MLKCSKCLCDSCIHDIDECPVETDCGESKCTVKKTCQYYEDDYADTVEEDV